MKVECEAPTIWLTLKFGPKIGIPSKKHMTFMDQLLITTLPIQLQTKGKFYRTKDSRDLLNSNGIIR